MLEILANANSNCEKTINPHCKKMFMAIEKLVFDENKIVGIISVDGETVKLI